MGGKKGPEKNRKYEKDRRDRFNEQFAELHKLLPDFSSSVIKVTKAEIIGRAIECLKDSQTKNQKLEMEFESEKSKISELQKKVAGLLQIVQELIKLLHKSNISFPSSLPVDDFKSFKDVYIKCKRKSKESVANEKKKKKQQNSEYCDSNSDVDSVDEDGNENTPSESKTKDNRVGNETVSPSESSAPTVVTTSVAVSVQQTICNTHVVNLELPKVLRIDTNPLILPNGNFVAVNGLQNTVLNNLNNSQTLLLNKQVTVPTFILMQNNLVPINTVQHTTPSHRMEKIIVPKQAVNTTKTTFINKKPIPAVRLYKSPMATKDNPRRTPVPKRKRSRRSKGILVKYPKRKPPTKGKKRESRIKKSAKLSPPVNTHNKDGEKATIADKNETYSSLPPCENLNETPYPANAVDINKTYSCADNIFDTPVIQTTGQFIDFFDNNSARCMDNNAENNGISAGYVENAAVSREKGEKQRIDNFADSSFERSYANASINCDLMENGVPKEHMNEIENQPCIAVAEKSLNYLSTSSTNDSLLLKYVPNNSANECPETISRVEVASARNENTVLDKRKLIEKEITPLTIHCNLNENKSSPKELTLSLIDDKKHYESSFDDLFTSLQVPSSGHNADSISPTAAFLHSFPLVSSCKNADLLPEHEDDSNTAATSSMTILQIGNLESPSTMLFTSNKSVNREGLAKNGDKIDDAGFATYCNSNLELENGRKEKSKDTCKDVAARSDMFNFGDMMNFKNQSKDACSKESVSQNVPLYPTSTNSTFPSYNIFTKYNDIPAVTCSYYSFSSQPFPITKTADPITDFNSWMPSVYNQEDATSKDKSKRDKSTSTTFKNTATLGLSTNELNTDRTKAKKPLKQSTARPLVNWMTTPDLRNVPDTPQSMDTFTLPKEDVINTNTFFSNPSVQNNSNFNVSYSSNDYFIDNQNYTDPQFTSCKITYSSANPSNYSWSPSKSTLPSLVMDTHNMIIPSTLPTLVGDLALGNNTSFNNYDLTSKKYELEKKKDTCKNYFKSLPQNSGSFLSVTQLVDDKCNEKEASKKSTLQTNCRFEEERDKCYKENYNLMNKSNENTEYCKKVAYSGGYKDSKSQNMKCKKDAAIVKYNPNSTRCISKENKKDTRNLQQKSFNEYTSQSCRMINKEVNPLSNKNSNYSAESLISTSNHQNTTCPAQSYLPYDNTTNYGNCGSNEYSKKRTEETQPITNVTYYPNSNYVYPNNFQSFNNYGFSNQCYNNYSSQIQQTTTGFQKKKDDSYSAKQDSSSDWYKESFPSYNSIVPTEFPASNQKLESKCKQPFSNNKFIQNQKNMINSETYNKYYQSGSSPSLSLNHIKSSCSFNSTYSFSQTNEQHCSGANCSAPNYEMKSNNRNSTTVMNSSNVHPATTLTNFNLSTIFPEINDKHCAVNPVATEKNNSEYTNKVNIEEMNYNYLIQPTTENIAEPPSMYGQSNFQIQHFTNVPSRKAHKTHK